ncbi:putative FBD domain-containing protein [Medicago truncatula]|uniref:Putative FBD domain-containing protein n=1 Tax=Medicago truncatula TaxID=3880 RepID=A0A396GF47_MEDTR|nr:putative FBD domain-containing protein [Medicago truncatula]
MHYILCNSCHGVICCRQEKPPLKRRNTQPSVPSCLVSQLAFIQFKGYQGLPDELLFVEYILRNGFALKTMVISDISVDITKKNAIFKRLSNVPRASGNCQLIFD